MMDKASQNRRKKRFCQRGRVFPVGVWLKMAGWGWAA